MKMADFLNIVSSLANLFTIATSAIAIWLFIFKRKTIIGVFRILINYSSQITLSELKIKLERLNDFNADDQEHARNVLNILSDIAGQIKGNPRLKKQCFDVLERIENFTDNPKATFNERKKRSLVSELREQLRHVDVKNFDELVGGHNE
jgi:hypothetical protein